MGFDNERCIRPGQFQVIQCVHFDTQNNLFNLIALNLWYKIESIIELSVVYKSEIFDKLYSNKTVGFQEVKIGYFQPVL